MQAPVLTCARLSGRSATTRTDQRTSVPYIAIWLATTRRESVRIRENNMSWTGFKKAVGRAGTQIQMKTGHVDKTIDRDFEAEERRYRV